MGILWTIFMVKEQILETYPSQKVKNIVIWQIQNHRCLKRFLHTKITNNTNTKLNALKDKIEIIEDDDAICMGTSNIANVVENIFNEREHRELRQA